MLLVSALIGLTLTACENDARIASQNLSQEADMFRVNRRIVFYNGINGEYILSVEGFCSINKDNADNQLEVTCKTGTSTFKKHFLGISDNVTYFAEQLESANVSTNHYKVIFKPQVIIPDIELAKGK